MKRKVRKADHFISRPVFTGFEIRFFDQTGISADGPERAILQRSHRLGIRSF